MILLALACGPSLNSPSLGEPVVVETRVEQTAVGSGEPVLLEVDLRAREGWTLDPEIALPEGLELAEESLDGDTLELTLTGPDGSYELPAFEVLAHGPDGEERTLITTPIFVDIGVVGPSSELQELSAASRPEPPKWPWVLGTLLGVVALAGAGAAAWKRFRPAEPLAPPTPPHLVALREWNEARLKLRGDDHALALALGGIFRRYVAGVTETRNATALTSVELLQELPSDWDGERCKRLLTATDLIKFARAEGGKQLFDQLDKDLKGVLSA